MHGGFVGIGTEYAMAGTLGLGPGWFWRNEYRYASYDSKSLTDTNGAGAQASNITFKPVVQTVNSEIVYKLNTGGPSYHSRTSAACQLERVLYQRRHWLRRVGCGYDDRRTAYRLLRTLRIVQRQGGKGWLGVAGAGFDYQIMPRIVAGVFGDFDFSSLKGTIQDQGPFFVGSIKQEDAWAVGATCGLVGHSAVADLLECRLQQRALLRHKYGDLPITAVQPVLRHRKPRFNGWFAGGGLEAPIMPNLFWRTEYRYASYDSKSLADTNGAGGFTPHHLQARCSDCHHPAALQI